MHKLLIALILSISAAHVQAEDLRRGEYFVTQSWSQETDFKRPYFVHVPEGKAEHPVLIFLHGNGGNAERAMQGFMRRNRTITSTYILVFAQGYLKSWNIVSERAKSDDRGFIEEIVTTLTTYDNVANNAFTIMGSSNGAALVNQIAIETKLPNIANYISVVSPLNGYQHDGKNFKAKGEDNDYSEIANPLTGKRLLNISGVEDHLVPYGGGPSKGIPAKDGKLPFVAAEASIYLWAKHFGFKGKKLDKPTSVNGQLETFSYLNGDVIHYKVVGEGHGAGGALNENMLLAFLRGNTK